MFYPRIIRQVCSTILFGVGIGGGLLGLSFPGPMLSRPFFESVAITEALEPAPDVAQLLMLINQERSQAGLAPLQLDPILTLAAQNHANAMARQNFFSHTNPEGSSTLDRVVALGYQGSVGENIAAGRVNPEWVMRQWLSSPGYQANLLAPQAGEIGLGYGINPESDYIHYWTAIVGTALPVAPESEPEPEPELAVEPEPALATEPEPSPRTAVIQEINPAEQMRDLLWLVNRERRQVCLPPLRSHPDLTQISQSYVDDLAAQGLSRWQGMPSDMLETMVAQRTDYSAINLGQAISQGTNRPIQVWQTWQLYTPTRELLLRPEYSDVGLGYAHNPNSPSPDYWHLVLAESRYPEPLNSDRIIETWSEAGRLDANSPELSVDGSRYALYDFDGLAGETFVIDLESEDFDAYLFLFNPLDQTIAGNDDREKSNVNARIIVTLPCDGTYRVMVNSYTPDSEGDFTLSISQVRP
ncbi:CAP domain-containing protein [Spirulina sp. CCNP1310]|uniref:CAP domain-containing protein n=1 Tax=Spirulina sp. CCNP1310 TaxID=3110249 RepID=UPI002B205D4F|nr:CAP domain-containing protein [Spirulina sp. CCNP1310]MEA5420183.1 CAP domain-containing protein [Spirulina sp. CCNP1310]